MTEQEYPLNMHNWGHSRKRRKPGDLFTYLMPDGKYRFMRFVSNSVNWYQGILVNLLYFYDFESDRSLAPPRDTFTPPELLLPPQLTNNLGWVRGWFKFVEHWPLEPGEVFPRHCFHSPVHRDFHDEDGNRVDEPFEPLGSRALTGYSMIDLDLSRVLSIPHAYNIARSHGESLGN